MGFLESGALARKSDPARGRKCVYAGIFFLIVPSLALAFLQGDFKISTDVFMVLLDVSVQDSKGAYISGLTKDEFQVFDNGTPQHIKSFTNTDVPVEAGLVLDESGSMRNKRPDVNMAGLAFVDGSNPNDQIFVVNFNDRVREGLPDGVLFSDNIEVLRSALYRGRTEGRTALYDAIAEALRHIESGQRDRKTLVVVSDGGDNISKLTLKDTLRLIEQSHATIYTVGIFDEDDLDRNPDVLKRIANISGGESFLLERYDQIVPTFKKIATDIRSRYTVGYVPQLGTGSGDLHRIKVMVNSPNHQHLVVRTRTTYRLPDQLVTQK